MPGWYFQNRFLNKEKPLQTVLFVTDYCNLKCKHCMPEGHGCRSMKSYEQIERELRYAYEQGSRFVDFEGGEPTLWRDGEKTLNDLYVLAKKIGFFSCTLTTNGQRPFGDTLADMVWVSVDGYREYHDAVRGKGTFKRAHRNIKESHHPAVSISMAVNKLNKDSVADTIRYARRNPAIKSIAFNFHTPFPGTEKLMMDWEERNKVIDLIIAFKKKGYPIMNTYSGLHMMKKKGFKKYCWVANYILLDGTKLKQCPGKVFGVCDECGFGMAGEMYALNHLHLDTVKAGLNLRLSK